MVLGPQIAATLVSFTLKHELEFAFEAVDPVLTAWIRGLFTFFPAVMWPPTGLASLQASQDPGKVGGV
ncbi:MAG: hypothetical protein CL923_11905 [Deltaproteobacteria bacterium]|jgi:hypothetical protein|nr:hypothetical protein [Deltaproteobacteria bacterium]